MSQCEFDLRLDQGPKLIPLVVAILLSIKPRLSIDPHRLIVAPTIMIVRSGSQPFGRLSLYVDRALSLNRPPSSDRVSHDRGRPIVVHTIVTVRSGSQPLGRPSLSVNRARSTHVI